MWAFDYGRPDKFITHSGSSLPPITWRNPLPFGTVAFSFVKCPVSWGLRFGSSSQVLGFPVAGVAVVAYVPVCMDRILP